MTPHPEAARVIDLIAEVAVANGVADFDPTPFATEADKLLTSGWFVHEVLAFARYHAEVTPGMGEDAGCAGIARCRTRAESRIAAL